MLASLASGDTSEFLVCASQLCSSPCWLNLGCGERDVVLACRILHSLGAGTLPATLRDAKDKVEPRAPVQSFALDVVRCDVERNWVRFFRRYEAFAGVEGVGYVMDFLVPRFRGYMREGVGRGFVGLEVGVVWEWAGLRFEWELEEEGGGKADKGFMEGKVRAIMDGVGVVEGGRWKRK